jgi:hypothetical protein
MFIRPRWQTSRRRFQKLFLWSLLFLSLERPLFYSSITDDRNFTISLCDVREVAR